jgi:hypothetical protein
MCVVTALVALVNVNAYGDTPCGNWVSPNYPKTADFESERPYGLKTKTADESTAVASTNAIASNTPTIVIFGVTTLALLTVGVLRRYQPSGGGTASGPDQVSAKRSGVLAFDFTPARHCKPLALNSSAGTPPRART